MLKKARSFREKFKRGPLSRDGLRATLSRNFPLPGHDGVKSPKPPSTQSASPNSGGTARSARSDKTDGGAQPVQATTHPVSTQASETLKIRSLSHTDCRKVPVIGHKSFCQ